MDTRGRRVLKLVGGVFTTVGLGLLGGGGWSANRQYTILKYWPTVEAQVVRSQVTHHLDHDRESNRDTDMYTVEIEFRYSVKGKEYLTPSNAGYSSSSYTEMKRMADDYAPGAKRPIKYNPSNPNDIRFNAGYTFGFFLLPFILGLLGVVFSVVGIGLLIGSRSGVAPRCPSCGQPVEPDQKFCPNCATPLRAAA